MPTDFIKLAALLGSGILSGGSIYVSAFAVPSILKPTQSGQLILPAKTLQAQWKHIYDTGKQFFPLLSLPTSALYGYLAYTSPSASRLYLFSACSTIAIIPYTMVLMMPTVRKCESQINEVETKDTLPELKQDIAKWAKLHYGRALLQFLGFVVGAFAIVDNS